MGTTLASNQYDTMLWNCSYLLLCEIGHERRSIQITRTVVFNPSLGVPLLYIPCTVLPALKHLLQLTNGMLSSYFIALGVLG